MNPNLKILKFIQKSEKLKTVKRSIEISDLSRLESPAEHSWRTALLAMALYDEGILKIDLTKTLKLIMLHDLPETITGDEWRTEKDEKHEKKIKDDELKAIKKIYYLLPGRSAKKLEKLAEDYAKQKSKEAKVAKALDKIEVIIQRLDIGPENWRRLDLGSKNLEKKDGFPIAYHWADECVAKVPELQDFWELVRSQLKKQYNKLHD